MLLDAGSAAVGGFALGTLKKNTWSLEILSECTVCVGDEFPP
jgi:hypothetical protein